MGNQNEWSALPVPETVQNVKGYNSWPFVQGLGRRLVCAYSRGDAHSIHELCRGVYARVSDDGGRTWGPEALVVNTPVDCESAIGKGLDNDGALLLWVRCIGPQWHHDLYRSEDGVSFTRLASLQLSPMPMQITDVMRLPDGALMSLWFSGDYSEQPTSSWGTLVSGDNGRTWTQHVVEDNLPKGDWPTEQSCVLLEDGRILGIARTEHVSSGVRNGQFQLQSTDLGRTWTKFRTAITDVSESTPSLIWDSATGLLSNYYYQRGEGILKRRAVRPDDVWNHPLAWPEPECIASGSRETYHAGNVNTCVFGGRHACIYYSGDEKQTDIVLYMANPPL